ncbi:hypothetical protein PSA7680_00290 [Pseudoruegeria aquimaris]|uniref:Uncharacterized protein n=1 Tax=Pseudoruegeria aquimaris TaxID=393663 RepID=A0A1Y5RCI3_9RHOB|nr:hypothetical protein PSA7680_00290 [Pseudoruegeria aquimaris]
MAELTPPLLAAAAVLETRRLAEKDAPVRSGVAQALNGVGLAKARAAVAREADDLPDAESDWQTRLRRGLRRAGRAAIACGAPVKTRLGLAKALNALGEDRLVMRLHRSVLEVEPGNSWSRLGLLDRLIAAGGFEEAQALIARAPAPLSGSPELAMRQAALLRRSGDLTAAAAALEGLLHSGGAPAAARERLARLLIESQRFAEAERVLEAGLGALPDNLPLWLLRVDLALQAADAAQAARHLARAEAACGPCRELKLKACRAGLRGPDWHAAFATLEKLRAAGAFEADIEREYALGLMRLGRFREAAACFETQMARDPEAVSVHVNLVDAWAGAGEVEAALRAAERAAARFPAEHKVQMRHHWALVQAGREEAAAQTLARIADRFPALPAVRLAQARHALEAGRAGESERLCAQVLEGAPLHLNALLGLEKALSRQGRMQEARTRLAAAVQTAAEPGTGGALAVLRLRLCELALDAGEPEQAVAWLEGFARSMEGAAGEALGRAFRLALALDRPDLAAAALDGLLRAPVVSRAAAGPVVRSVAALSDPALAGSLAQALSARMPAPERKGFATEVTTWLDGPIEALRQSRRTMPVAGSRRDTAQRARLLIGAGQRCLAQRYLRACVRAWPGHAEFGVMLAETSLRIGDLAGARAAIQSLTGRVPQERLHALRAQLLLREGDPRAAQREAAAAAAVAPSPGAFTEALRIALARGDLPAAETFAAAWRQTLGAQSLAQAHFQSSLLGAQLNELRIAKGHPAQERYTTFVHPARGVVARWMERRGGRPFDGEAEIPRRIWQFWDAPTPPPDVAAVMEAFREEGFAYERLTQATAMEFLKAQFGPLHLRAFRLAEKGAEAADFLRLCVLLKHGGLYADADDRRVGPLAPLLAGRSGCILFREPHGALANNVIIASPGHPVLHLAVEMAMRSLLARERDNTWARTGPGLLTRATATALRHEREALRQAGLCILPESALAPHIGTHLALPYKSTSAYWNWSGARALPEAVRAVLDWLAPGGGQGVSRIA